MSRSLRYRTSASLSDTRNSDRWTWSLTSMLNVAPLRDKARNPKESRNPGTDLFSFLPAFLRGFFRLTTYTLEKDYGSLTTRLPGNLVRTDRGTRPAFRSLTVAAPIARAVCALKNRKSGFPRCTTAFGRCRIRLKR